MHSGAHVCFTDGQQDTDTKTGSNGKLPGKTMVELAITSRQQKAAFQSDSSFGKVKSFLGFGFSSLDGVCCCCCFVLFFCVFFFLMAMAFKHVLLM